jgi:hypothetical protein
MPSGPDLLVYHDPADLPADACTLFGRGFFDSIGWYETTCRAALPAGAVPEFVVVNSHDSACAVLPMLRHGTRVTSLTTPYSCLWHPLGRTDLSAAAWRDLGARFAIWCRACGTVRLDALDPADASYAPFLAGVRTAGLHILPFDHFGNWYCALPAANWDTYLAARPGALREAIRRRTKKLLSEGAEFTTARGSEGLDAVIAAYEAVYAKSWKEPEPFPSFNAALMRSCAADGSLRFGLLKRDSNVLAVQFWVVRERWAAVLKLAHDEAAKAYSPGTVLTAMMIRALLEQDGVTELDFGRGDDPYKKDWTGLRRQRTGVVLANPWRPAGALAIARGAVRGFLR